MVKDDNRLKFEYPDNLFLEAKHTDVEGNTWTINHKTINDWWDREYKHRIKLLDLALSVEAGIDRIISARISDSQFNDYFINDVVLSKIETQNKILILRSIIEENQLIQNNKLNFNKIDNTHILVESFRINLSKFFETIELINKIRNQVVHQHYIIYSARDTIIQRSRKDNRPNDNEHDREKVMIRGHFVLWTLNNFIKEHNLLNQETYITYYKRYKEVLTDIAILNENLTSN